MLIRLAFTLNYVYFKRVWFYMNGNVLSKWTKNKNTKKAFINFSLMRRISCVKNLFKKTVEFCSCYGGNIKFFFLAATYNSSRYKTSSILILMLKLCVSTNRAQKKSGPSNTNNFICKLFSLSTPC